jgi:hypothetical protein
MAKAAKGKRPDLTKLPIGRRMAGSQAQATTSTTKPSATGGDVKTILLRLNREGWAELRKLSVDTDTALDTLLVEAANSLLAKHGRPAVVEKRLPRKAE